MNILNLIVNFYGALYNRKYIPARVLSPVRFILRFIANKTLPLYLNHAYYYHSAKLQGEKKIIVSLTSFPGRITTVWMVVECMLRQTVKPDAIILYLSKKQFSSMDVLPDSLKRRIGNIFQIKLVENDFRSHKKYFYAFLEYPDDIVITIDDDIFYPTKMIEDLINQHKKNPDAIICRYGCKISYDKDGNLLPYTFWEESYNYHKINFFGSGGGTLFTPSKLYKDVTDINLAVKLCPLADDVWLNAMVRLKHLDVICITRNLILPIFSDSKESLCSINNGEKNMNDVQLRNVIDYYKKIKDNNPFSL